MKKTRLELVDDWRRAWRWLSVRCMLLAIALQSAWVAIPDDLRAGIAAEWVNGISIVVLVLGTIGRLVKEGAGGESDDAT